MSTKWCFGLFGPETTNQVGLRWPANLQRSSFSNSSHPGAN